MMQWNNQPPMLSIPSNVIDSKSWGVIVSQEGTTQEDEDSKFEDMAEEAVRLGLESHYIKCISTA